MIIESGRFAPSLAENIVTGSHRFVPFATENSSFCNIKVVLANIRSPEIQKFVYNSMEVDW